MYYMLRNIIENSLYLVDYKKSTRPSIASTLASFILNSFADSFERFPCRNCFIYFISFVSI